MTRQELLDLKKDIEGAKVTKIQLETKREQLLEEMKEKWGCNTIEEAQTKVEALDKELKESFIVLQEKLEDIERGTSAIENKKEPLEEY